jgi:uncharacterized beta-barrel protein YwiB (DUF1934 family)
MEPNAIITIEGQQWSGDEDPQSIRLTTEGHLYHQDTAWYVVYDESEATGMEGSQTTVRVADNGEVTLLRSGSHGMKLTFIAGARHITRMQTPYGDLDVGIYTSVVHTRLSQAGGSIHLGYSIDFNQQDPTNTRLNMEIRALGPKKLPN